MRCLVVANALDADSGFVGERLRHHGYTLHEGHREHPADWPDLPGHDLVLLLGSEWSAYDPAVAESVAAESRLIRQAIERGVPILGICFGALMVSRSVGGQVTRATRPEVGWHMIDSDLPLVVAPGPWLQWHYDVFETPPGFDCLGRSASGPQVIRAERVLATQFHPEATETMLARWSAGAGVAELERMGSARERCMDETRAQVVASRGRCDRLVDWFVESVAHGH
ncbi:MAG: type 1 glutamine amidotransferase [Ilumatobacteraceae bacterium]